MMNKYRVHEVAKDFKLNSKDIAEIMTKYSQTPKNHMQVLEERELAVIFDYLTQHNQVENIESIFADVYHEPKPAQAKPAQPQQSAAKPAAKGESRPQSAAPQADKSGEQPRAQGGKTPARAEPSTWRSTTSGWSPSLTSVSRTGAASRSSRDATPSASAAASRGRATSASRRSRSACAVSSWRSPRRHQ